MVNPLGHWIYILFGTSSLIYLHGLSRFWGIGFRIPLRILSGFWVLPVSVVPANPFLPQFSGIGTLRGSELVDGFALVEFLSWNLYWFTYFGFSWTTCLTVTIRGISGGWLHWVFPKGSSMHPCSHFLVWIVGLLVINSVVPKLNPVRHERLHIWKTSLAC